MGHGLLAFALVALLARLAGWSRERALAVGLLAGAFGLLPDVDMVYAPVGLALSGADGVLDAAETFWAASTLVHRAVTHSLLVGSVAAVAFALWARGSAATPDPDRRLPAGRGAGRAAALALLGGLCGVAAVRTGALGLAVMTVFAAGGLALTVAARRRGLPPRAVLGAALAGLLTHPFGDLFTGRPPELLYPLDVHLVAERVALSPDPTLHLLSAFGLELLTVWAAAAVYLALSGRTIRTHLDGRAALGLGYGAAAFVLPAPTLEFSYPFVFSVLAVGLVGVLPGVRAVGSWPRSGAPRRFSPWRAFRPRHPLRGERPRRPWRRLANAATGSPPTRRLVRGLSAVTLALVAYAAVYLLAW